MSKELIERMKSYIPNGDGHNSQYANDLADAVAILEDNAASVGEPDCDRSACGDFSPGPCDNPDCQALRSNKASTAGELRAGQEPVAFYWQDVGYKNPNRHGPYFGWPTEAALRNVDGGAVPVPLYTAPQPSAVPEEKE